MATLATLIAAALVRLGLQVSRDQGWYPRSFYLRASLEALKNGDTERAIDELRRGWRESDPGEEAEVVREVILMSLDTSLARLDREIADEQRLMRVADGEVTVLDLRVRRRRFQTDRGMQRVTAGAAIVVGASTALSVSRFGLHPGVALLGLCFFAAAAVLLLTADHRRQRAEYEELRNVERAEVAEEIQILRADLERRRARVERLAGDRRVLATRRQRVEQIGGAGV